MASLRELGEFGFISKVAQLAGAPPEAVIEGIAEDCAVIDVGGPQLLLVSTDAAVEGRHFDLDWLTPYEAGRRAVACALSDIAAMGGATMAILCTASVPVSLSPEASLEVMRGVAEAARSWGAPLVGGDTVAAPRSLALDIVALGLAQTPLLRSGVRRGDKLVLTGSIGGAAAGLAIARRDPALLSAPAVAPLRERLVSPTPRLAEAQALAATGLVHAAIDISDGLYQDAGHLAARSGLRIELDAARLPIHEAAASAMQALPGIPPWWAATGGEDYELLLAVDRDDLLALQAVTADLGLAPLTPVGDAVPGAGVVLIGPNGSELELERGGWDQFRPPQPV